MPATLLAAGHSTPALSTVVSWPSSTPGRGLFLAAVAAATITGLPAAWVTVDYEVANQGCLIGHLPGASNPGGAGQVTLTHNGPRQCAWAVWEDDVAASPGPGMVAGLTEGSASTLATVATPSATTSGRSAAAAVFGMIFGGGDGTGYTPTGVDSGFSVLGDSGTTAVASEGARLVVATRTDPVLSGPVTATFAAAVNRTPTTGVLVWDVQVTPPLPWTPVRGARLAVQGPTRGLGVAGPTRALAVQPPTRGLAVAEP